MSSRTRAAHPSEAAVASVLALVMASTTWTIHIFSVLGSLIIADLRIARWQLGLLMTLSSLLAAGVSPLAGRVADKIGGRSTLVWALALSLFSVAIVSLGPTYGSLILGSLIAGSMSSLANPGTNKLITDFLPLGRRGWVMGVKQSGVQAGIFGVGVALPGLSLLLGWRGAVAILGVIPIVLIVTVSRLFHKEHPSNRDVEGVISESEYSHSPTVRSLAIYAFFMGVGGAGITSFLPLYAQESLGFGVAAGGYAAAGIGLVGIGSRIVLSRRAELSGEYWAVLRTMAWFSVVSALLLYFAQWGATWILWPGVALAGVAVVSWNGVALLAAVADAGRAGTGRASGLVLSGFFAGLAVSPVTVGVTVDVTGNYDLAWSLVAGAFVVAALTLSRGDPMRDPAV